MLIRAAGAQQGGGSSASVVLAEPWREGDEAALIDSMGEFAVHLLKGGQQPQGAEEEGVAAARLLVERALQELR